VPAPPMRFHPLAPDARCPGCGAEGLTFIRVRRHDDLYCCAAIGPCGCRSVHYRKKTTKTCRYSVIYGLGGLGEWNRVRREARGEHGVMPSPFGKQPW
jgi:hypothetical protein